MQYREELVLNVTVLVVSVWGLQYRQDVILNVTVFGCELLGRAVERETCTEYYSVFVRVCGGQY